MRTSILMRNGIAVLMLAVSLAASGLMADEKPKITKDPVSADNRTVGTAPAANVQMVTQEPTIAALKNEIEYLKTQLALMQLELEIWNNVPVIRVRLAAKEAAAKMEETRKQAAVKPKVQVK